MHSGREGAGLATQWVARSRPRSGRVGGSAGQRRRRPRRRRTRPRGAGPGGRWSPGRSAPRGRGWRPDRPRRGRSRPRGPCGGFRCRCRTGPAERRAARAKQRRDRQPDSRAAEQLGRKQVGQVGGVDLDLAVPQQLGAGINHAADDRHPARSTDPGRQPGSGHPGERQDHERAWADGEPGPHRGVVPHTGEELNRVEHEGPEGGVTLVGTGILERRPYSEHPARYEYRLTEAGRELYPVILTLMRWGDRHLAGDDGPPLVLQHHCGHRLVAQGVCEACGEPGDARRPDRPPSAADSGPRTGRLLGPRSQEAVRAPGGRPGLGGDERLHDRRCSGVLDHTSVLRFIETRFGVKVPNLSAWRRGVTGDITGALALSQAPNTTVPALPATSLGDTSVAEQAVLNALAGTLDVGIPYPLPKSNSMPAQESTPARPPVPS